ncbi:VapC toxin family PIN domain ribonuclease [archaeon SCG-AAA382B04]|nr:VapC toxin family PIN domain ribonuclease [archaeon SCG-AAA382B04]
MSVLVDTGIFYAYQNKKANRYKLAKKAMKKILEGELSQPWITDYIYDEVITLTKTKTGNFEQVKSISKRILGKKDFYSPFKLEFISKKEFKEAKRLLFKYNDQSLSFTDLTTIATTRENKIDGVLSFDSDFDGIIKRFRPKNL